MTEATIFFKVIRTGCITAQVTEDQLRDIRSGRLPDEIWNEAHETALNDYATETCDFYVEDGNGNMLVDWDE